MPIALCEEVGQGLWLVLDDGESLAGMGVQDRYPRDRAASARAEAWAVRALGLAPERCTTSRSHTMGIGAALVSCAPARLGVDLVPVGRVTPRHAAQILSGREWEALAPHASVRPALAWALKEAAAKGSGEPRRTFPAGVIIEKQACRLVVRLTGMGGMPFAASWCRFRDLLCAWVTRAPGP